MIQIGQIYKLRVVPAESQEWVRLKVTGFVPSRDGEKTSHYSVQIPGAEVETREIAGTTLLAECDLEP
jgi:hypothetical protein